MTELTDMFQAPDEGPRPERHGLGHGEGNELFRRLVIDAQSLLPRCQMPVARILFDELLDELSALHAELPNDRRVGTFFVDGRNGCRVSAESQRGKRQ